LYAEPTLGNLPTNPTPIRLLLQEVSVEFKGDLKKLYTQGQFPIATARGKLDVTGKAKIVNYDPDPINQLFWAQTSAAGIQVPIDRELANIPAVSTFTITVANAANFAKDNGVTYTTGAKPGAVLLKVTSGPATGQYSVNSTTGVYTFAAVDNSLGVAISYTYTNATRGKTITLNNQLMGYAPVCRVDVWNNFRNQVLGIRLNACTFGSWTYPSKLEDFWVSDVAFDANTDSADALGALFADTF
jgi:hypothetical protein